jgi:hypothetical protein
VIALAVLLISSSRQSSLEYFHNSCRPDSNRYEMQLHSCKNKKRVVLRILATESLIDLPSLSILSESCSSRRLLRIHDLSSALSKISKNEQKFSKEVCGLWTRFVVLMVLLMLGPGNNTTLY